MRYLFCLLFHRDWDRRKIIHWEEYIDGWVCRRCGGEYRGIFE